MTIHDGNTTLTDRIALSALLYELADGFAHEAKLWKAADTHSECERTSRHLAELARGVVSGAADYTKAEAFTEAGTVILGNVIGARRFFASVLAEPSRSPQARQNGSNDA